MQQQAAQASKEQKILSEDMIFEEGEGEEFKVKVRRASNGYIIENADGKTMVFSEDQYPHALEFIVKRRLVKMNEGDEIEINLQQRFTKINKT